MTDTEVRPMKRLLTAVCVAAMALAADAPPAPWASADAGSPPGVVVP